MKRAHLLAQLIAPRFQLFGLRDRLAPALVEGSKIAQQRRRVRSPRTQFFFHFFQVAPDKSQVEHLPFSLLDTGRGKPQTANLVRERVGLQTPLKFLKFTPEKQCHLKQSPHEEMSKPAKRSIQTADLFAKGLLLTHPTCPTVSDPPH